MSYTNNSLFQSIDTLIDKKIENVKFDITIICKILENQGNGKYIVSNESSTFFAYAEKDSYIVGQKVYVMVPQADYNMKKIIMGNYFETNEKEEYIYEESFSKIIAATDNILKDTPSITIETNQEDVTEDVAYFEKYNPGDLTLSENEEITVSKDKPGLISFFQTSNKIGVKITKNNNEIGITRVEKSRYKMPSNFTSDLSFFTTNGNPIEQISPGYYKLDNSKENESGFNRQEDNSLYLYSCRAKENSTGNEIVFNFKSDYANLIPISLIYNSKNDYKIGVAFSPNGTYQNSDCLFSLTTTSDKFFLKDYEKDNLTIYPIYKNNLKIVENLEDKSNGYTSFIIQKEEEEVNIDFYFEIFSYSLPMEDKDFPNELNIFIGNPSESNTGEKEIELTKNLSEAKKYKIPILDSSVALSDIKYIAIELEVKTQNLDYQKASNLEYGILIILQNLNNNFDSYTIIFNNNEFYGNPYAYESNGYVFRKIIPYPVNKKFTHMYYGIYKKNYSFQEGESIQILNPKVFFAFNKKGFQREEFKIFLSENKEYVYPSYTVFKDYKWQGFNKDTTPSPNNYWEYYNIGWARQKDSEYEYLFELNETSEKWVNRAEDIVFQTKETGEINLITFISDIENNNSSVNLEANLNAFNSVYSFNDENSSKANFSIYNNETELTTKLALYLQPFGEGNSYICDTLTSQVLSIYKEISFFDLIQRIDDTLKELNNSSTTEKTNNLLSDLGALLSHYRYFKPNKPTYIFKENDKFNIKTFQLPIPKYFEEYKFNYYQSNNILYDAESNLIISPIATLNSNSTYIELIVDGNDKIKIELINFEEDFSIPNAITEIEQAISINFAENVTELSPTGIDIADTSISSKITMGGLQLASKEYIGKTEDYFAKKPIYRKTKFPQENITKGEALTAFYSDKAKRQTVKKGEITYYQYVFPFNIALASNNISDIIAFNQNEDKEDES